MTNGDESLDDMIRRDVRTIARRQAASELREKAHWYRMAVELIEQRVPLQTDEMFIEAGETIAILYGVMADEFERLARKLTTETT